MQKRKAATVRLFLLAAFAATSAWPLHPQLRRSRQQLTAAAGCVAAVTLLCWPCQPTAAAPAPAQTCGTFQLQNLQYQGSGGTGTVYSATASPLDAVVLKVSNPTTAAAVAHECEVLRTLEARGVRGVERCLAQCSTPTPAAVMAPFVPGAVASLSDPRLSSSTRLTAVHSLGTTVVDAILAGVASSDLQPLVDPRTGQTLLIDLSEAVVFANPGAPSYLEAQTARNFLSEYMSWVAEKGGNGADAKETATLLHEAEDVARQRVDAAQQRRGAGDQAPTAAERIVLDMLAS